MTTPLKIVPPDGQADPDDADDADDLRDAAIAWADSTSALAQGLADGLRSGCNAADVALAMHPIARQASALLEALCDMLDQAAAVRK